MRIQFKFTESFNPPFNAPKFDNEKVAAITDSVEAANERVLAYVVDANRRLADFAVTSADRVAEALPVAVPFADKLPTATESAERYVDFVAFIAEHLHQALAVGTIVVDHEHVRLFYWRLG